MFTTDVKQRTKTLINENSESGKYLPGILLKVIPGAIVICVFIIATMILKSKGMHSKFLITTITSIFSFIMMYFTFCFTVFSIDITKVKTNIKKSMMSKKLTIMVMPIIIILLIINNLLESYGFSKGIVLTWDTIILVNLVNSYLRFMIISYKLNDGKVKHSIILKAFAEGLWKQLILFISFIPLGILIFLTFGILYFWKATYMNAVNDILLLEIYEKYQNEEACVKKANIRFGIPIIILIVLIGYFGVGKVHKFNTNFVNNQNNMNVGQPVNMNSQYQKTYKLTAGNGLRYTFVVQNGSIVNLNYGSNSQEAISTKDTGTQKDLYLNGSQTVLYAIFDGDKFMGLRYDENQSPSQYKKASISEIVNGSSDVTSSSTTYGQALQNFFNSRHVQVVNNN